MGVIGVFNMNHCKDCSHWDQTNDNDRYIPDKTWGLCRYAEDWFNNPFFIAVSSDRDAGLATKDTFGCIMFEARARKDVLTELAAYDQKLDI